MAYKLFVQRVGLVGVTNLVVSLRGLFILPIIAKTLGAADYGIWAMIVVMLALTSTLSRFGLTKAFSRFVAGEKEKNKIREGYYSSLIIIILFASMIAGMLFMISTTFDTGFFGDADSIYLIQLSLILIPLQAMNALFKSYFVIREQMKLHSIFVMLQAFGEVGLIACLVLTGHGIFGAIAAMLIMQSIVNVIMSGVIYHQIGFKLPDFSTIKPYLGYGVPTLPSTLSQWITDSSDRFMISYFMGNTSVGIYSAAYSIGIIISMFSAPIKTVLTPRVFNLWGENEKTVAKLYIYYASKFFLMIAIPGIFGLAVLAEPLLLLLTTTEFIQNGVIIVPIVATGVLLLEINRIIVSNIISLHKKTKAFVVIWTTSAITNILLNILLIPLLGILGAGIATVISYLLALLIGMCIAFRDFEIDIPWKFITKSLVASVVMFLLLQNLDTSGIVNILTTVFIGACTYLLVLLILKGFDKKELELFRSFLR